jgi:hypothetical protein
LITNKNGKEETLLGFVILILLIIGLVALAVSYYKQDSVKQMENQLEENSITMMQELYKVKKKIRVLEEEMMIGNRDNFKG